MTESEGAMTESEVAYLNMVDACVHWREASEELQERAEKAEARMRELWTWIRGPLSKAICGWEHRVLERS